MSQQSRTELEAESLLAIHQCQVTEIKKGSGWKAIMFTVFVRCGRTSPHVSSSAGYLENFIWRQNATSKQTNTNRVGEVQDPPRGDVPSNQIISSTNIVVYKHNLGGGNIGLLSVHFTDINISTGSL